MCTPPARLTIGHVHVRHVSSWPLSQARELFRNLPSLVDIDIPDDKHFTVCGDVHGQYYDLLNIWELNGLPGPDNPYLFNGEHYEQAVSTKLACSACWQGCCLLMLLVVESGRALATALLKPPDRLVAVVYLRCTYHCVELTLVYRCVVGCARKL